LDGRILPKGFALLDLKSPTIVLGMHRSGTSLLTGTLEASGMFLGEVNIAAPFNRKGNREPEGLRRLHDQILSRVGHSWRSPPDKTILWSEEDLREVIRTLEVFRGRDWWGFKDPRSIWLLEGYLQLFPDAQLIAIAREPRAVAASLMARPGELRLSAPEGLNLWLRTNARLLSLWNQYKFPILRFSSLGPDDPLFLGPLALFLARAQNGSCSFDSGAASAFFEAELVHQTGRELEECEQCAQLWQRLQDAAWQSLRTGG
jgi:hypothetical protein